MAWILVGLSLTQTFPSEVRLSRPLEIAFCDSDKKLVVLRQNGDMELHEAPFDFNPRSGGRIIGKHKVAIRALPPMRLQIVAVDKNGLLELFDIPSDKVVWSGLGPKSIPEYGWINGPNVLACAPDGARFCVTSPLGFALFQRRDPLQESTWTKPLERRRDESLPFTCLDASDDHLAVGWRSRESRGTPTDLVELFDLRTSERIGAINDRGLPLAFLGNNLVLSSPRGGLKLWNRATGETKQYAKDLPRHRSTHEALVCRISIDGRQMFCVREGPQEIDVFQISNELATLTFEFGPSKWANSGGNLPTVPCEFLRGSSDLIAYQKKYWTVLDATHGGERVRLVKPADLPTAGKFAAQQEYFCPTQSVPLSTDGKRIAFGTYGGNIYVESIEAILTAQNKERPNRRK